MSARRRFPVAVGLAAGGLALALSACSAGADSGTDPDAVMFAQMMIPHHEQAVEMAALAQTRAEDPFIVDLAAEIARAQQPEIDQMSGWLEEWGAPRQSGEEAMAEHGGHGMAGMLTTEQLDALAAASGAEFDRLFAEAMIEHHEGAVDMAMPVVDSPDPEVSALAQDIMSTQEQEIADMREFLADAS